MIRACQLKFLTFFIDISQALRSLDLNLSLVQWNDDLDPCTL